MPATLSPTTMAMPLRPLAETATLFRQECSALDHLVEELFRDVEQLREELVRKADEIEENRKRLAHRGAQLAEQRKETSRLVHLLEQQESRAAEALTEIRALREQSAREREDAQVREAARLTFLEQKLRAAESERDELRHELNVLQATASVSSAGIDSLTPLMSELGDLRRQITETQSQVGDARDQLTAAIAESAAAIPPAADPLPTLMSELAEMRRQLSEAQAQATATQVQLGDARTQLAEAIERAAAAAAYAPPPVVLSAENGQLDAETRERVAALDREKIELEAELELVRTRATELQEVVNQQRRELVEQRADVTTELRLLRELVEERRVQPAESFEPPEDALVSAARRREALEPEPDPVVSSVMAQFARLQKDVAQRRKKK